MAEKSVTFKMVLQDLVTPVAQKISTSVDNATQHVVASVNEANSQVVSMTTTIGDSTKPLDQVRQKVDQAAASVTGKLTPAVRQTTAAVKETNTETSKLPQKLDDATKSGGGFTKKIGEISEKMEKVVKIATLVTAAIKGIEVGVNGVRLVSALWTGDWEKQIRAAKGIEDSLRSLPGGNVIVDLGASINNLVTGEKDATEEIERQTAKLDKQNEALERRRKETDESKAALKSFMETVQGQADSIFRTQEETQKRSLENLKKAQAEVLNLPGIDRAKKEVKDFITETNAIISRITERQALEHTIDLRAAQNELVEAQLKDVDRVAEADRVAFVASLDEKQRAAAKLGSDFSHLQEKINNTLLATFDKQANDKRRDFLESIDTDLSTRLLKATGSPADSRAAASLDLQFRQDKESRSFAKSLNEQGVPQDQQQGFKDRLSLVQSMEQAQLRYNQAVEGANEVESHFSDQLDLIHSKIDTGQISIIEGSDAIRSAQSRFNDEIAKTIALLQQMKDQATDPAQQQAIQEQIDKITTNANRARASVSTFGSETANILQNSLEPAISGVIQGTTSIKDAFKGMLQSIAKGFADLAAKILANLVIRRLLSSAVGGFDSGLLATPTGFAGGGLVGGQGTGDIVPAMLTPGEYVIPAQVVSTVGVPFFDDLRAKLFGGKIPTPRLPPSGAAKFGTGGLVGNGGARTEIPTLVADESTLDRLLAGGGNALVSSMGKRRDAIRKVLGID
jgi:hypothetical protein